MATSVSVINMKGGVGKTTLTAQLAHACDGRKLRTLVVDLDPQANLSQALLSPEAYVKHLRDQRPTIVQVFDRFAPPGEGGDSPRPVRFSDTILRGVGDGAKSSLDLIPSRLELARVLKHSKSRVRNLARGLSRVSLDYDLILIDCAPTESLLTDAAYHASRYVLVPVKPEFLATIGLPLLERSIQTFKYENRDCSLDLCGIVFNHSSTYSRGPEGKRSIREVKQAADIYNWRVFGTSVRYSASYAKAAREGSPIARTSYVRRRVRSEFDDFVQEFLKAIGLGEEG